MRSQKASRLLSVHFPIRIAFVVWLLLVPLIGGVSVPQSSTQAASMSQSTTTQLEVRVIIESLSAKDNIDSGGDPDMYAVVAIDGQESNNQTTAIEDQSNITPNWQFFEVVDANRNMIPIAINIFDRDGFLRGGDDHVDIAAPEGRALDLQLDLQSCAIRGDTIIGTCGNALTSIGTEDDRAEVRFRVEVRPTVPVKLKVIIEHVNELACFDDAWLFCESSGDWFTIINIDGQELGNLESETEDDDFSPNWEFRRVVDFGKGIIPIAIGLYDEDASIINGFAFSTQQGDIKPGSGSTLNIRIDLNSCISGGDNAISGDISGKCGNSLSTSGSEEDDDRAQIRFRIEAEPPPSAPGLNVRCLHSPIWPQATDMITVAAEALAGDPNVPKGFNVDIEIWINNKNAPAATISNQSTFTIKAGSFNSGDTFFYGCLVRDRTTGERAWSGWRQAQVGFPVEGRAIPLVYTGSRASSIDIVFVADRDDYADSNNPDFLDDVQNVIKKSYYSRQIYLANQDKLNFWLATDMGQAEDSADGCDHEWPAQSFGDYSFADTSAIIHRKSIRDCAPGGERVFSAEIPEYDVFTHETGHRPFGLADEYCDTRNPPAGNRCDGGYFQADPFPNVYANMAECIADIGNLQIWDEKLGHTIRSIENCKQFGNRDWFTSEPVDDLMVLNQTIRAADARRMNWLFDLCDQASCGPTPMSVLPITKVLPQAAIINDPRLDPIPVLDFAQQRTAKSLDVRVDFAGRDQLSLNTSRLGSGQTYTYTGDPPLLHIRLLDQNKAVLQEYNAWHPLWTFAYGDDGHEHLTIENAATGSFMTPLLPKLKFMEIYDSAQQKLLTTINLETSIIQPFCEQHPADPDCKNRPSTNRIRTGLQALYTFEEGAGSIINDVSGVGTPLNLKMSDSTKTQWTTDGLLITGPTTIASLLPATKIVDAARASNEISLEAWVKSATSAGATSGSIIALSTDINNRNITLEQQSNTKGDAVNFLSHVRTSTTAPQGVEVKASDGYPAQELIHVMLTRDAAGTVRLYVNGVEQKHKTLTGDFSTWDNTASLVLANELLADTAWLGEYQLVAVYSRALNAAEVRQNYHSGPKGLATVCYATADKHDGVSDQLIVFSDGLPRTTPVRTIGTDDIEALTFQPATNVLYAANADQLGILDLVSGTFAPTSSTFGKGRGADGLIAFKNIDGLAFDQTDGTLYGVHRRSEDPSDQEVLFKIDVGTGAAIPDAFGAGVDYVVIQGAGLLPDVDDIAIEPQSGQMYATSDNNGQGSVLIAIDKHTGVATPKGAYGVEDIDGLTFTESGKLYGLTGNSNRGNTTDSQIYAINLDNGQASFVSQLDRVRDYEAAACRPALRSAMVRSLLSVEPGQGSAHQVVPIMVTGTGFVEGSTIRIGTTALQTTFVSDTQLQARVPAGLRPGLYNIVVVYPDGTSDLLPSAYNVFAPTFYAYLPVVQP